MMKDLCFFPPNLIYRHSISEGPTLLTACMIQKLPILLNTLYSRI